MNVETGSSDVRGAQNLGGLALRILVLQGAQLALFHHAQVHQDLPWTPLRTFEVFLGVLLGSLSSLVSQVVIHACAHPGSFSGSRSGDNALRLLLSIVHLIDERDYLVLHHLHHVHTNEAEDPNAPRPGESWLHYVLSLLPRQWTFSKSPLYRSYYDRFFDPRGSWETIRRSVPTTLLRDALLLALVVLLAVELEGVRGVVLVLVWWLLPVVGGHVLIADFAYRSHVGLPCRRDCRPYAGQDTHSLRDGIAYFLLNQLTWGFYDHRDHHRYPRHTIWASRKNGLGGVQ